MGGRRHDHGAPGPATLEWAVRAAGASAVLDVRPLGVGSTALHLLQLDGPDAAEHRLLLRRYVDDERVERDPWYVPRHEVAALELLDPAPVPTPRLIAADVDASECDVPTLLTTYLDGRPGDDPRHDLTSGVLAQHADALAAIHAVGGDGVDQLPGYAPYQPVSAVRIPAWSTRPDTWERVLGLLADRAPDEGAGRVIHRDYHPGNTLWVDGELTGVVDWTTACLGPPAIDLARLRQNLVLLHDHEAADRFLERYVAETGRAHDRHPWWDLRDAADMLVDTSAPSSEDEARRLERWEGYVAGVAAEL